MLQKALQRWAGHRHLEPVKSRAPCPPQTRIHLPLGRKASGEIIWSPPFRFDAGEPKAIGRHDVGQVKICGPGKFVFSPMTCGNKDYYYEEFKHSRGEVTTECRVVPVPMVKHAGLGCIFVECTS
mmetsp:Transcript_32029/g.63097  ORF Transcript_32029/g.63097 Transcript_32029/m.63097 type:complete len:125 (-) Transcript_32029:118-492(-)